MKLLISIAARFYRGPDGRIYPEHALVNYHFFSRYLEVFEEVVVLARVREGEGEEIHHPPADGPGVSFAPVPCFNGIFDLMKDFFRIRAVTRRAAGSCQAFILRVPCFVGSIAWGEIRRLGMPFGLEVVGDPADALTPEGVRHPLLPLIRGISIRCLRLQCAQARAVAYVTREFLQQRYPPGEGAFSTHYSSINLPASLFVERPREFSAPAVRLVHVGASNVFYKAPDVLIDALALLRERGLALHLDYVGDGSRQGELISRVQSLGLDGQVTFLGQVSPGAGVAAALDAAEVFVLPSRQEGLPRAMIEAMARGLPCIGSTAGGIPELLPPEDLAPPGDARALADKIMEVVNDPARMNRMAARNLTAAQEYRQEIIHARRTAFYRQIRAGAAAGPGGRG